MEQNLDVITINGKKYYSEPQKEPEIVGNIKIVILQRGWVVIGVWERNGNDCKLHNASVIRRWGTTKGLGELAKDGKLKDTILEKCHGVVEFDYLNVIASIACEESKWKKEL
jgi:hypothetical protein